MVVPTDKTNQFRTVKTSDYITWVGGHLDKSAKMVPRERLVEIEGDAFDLLERLDGVLLMTDKEHDFVKESLESKAVPTPQLLIKDHKDPDENGAYPTWLIVPATNFAAAFSKLGYKGIKAIFDMNGIKIDRFTIVQVAHLKKKFKI